MIITLICFGVGCILFPIFLWIEKKTYADWAGGVAVVCAVLGIVGFIICNLFMLGVATTKNVEYEKVLYEREILEYRLEHIDEFVNGNEFLYSEITKFNNELHTVKRYAASPWTNCFFNEKVASIDYIEFE